MLTSEKIKRYAKRCGADIVGVASMNRFEGAPRPMDPRCIFPDAKSMIVMGFRHFRGVFRGIEEGTFWTAYSAMGYAGINYVHQPLVIWNVSRMIEDEGYEAVGIPNIFPWTYADFHFTNPKSKPQGTVRSENTNLSISTPAKTPVENPILFGGDSNLSAPVLPDAPAPNVFIQVRIAAFCAGLGEIGYSKMFLSPEFGPRQRLAAIMTDAPLKPDPIFAGKLCDRCMACVRGCSVGAIPKDKTVKVTIAGRELEWADIDMRKCCVGFSGGSKESNPFMVTPEDKTGFTEDVTRVHEYKLRPIYIHSRALEGASGCIRACMIHLEKQGKIKNLFKEPFRKRKPWRL